MNQPKFAIEMRNITKSFLDGKIIANDDVNLLVKKNEVHALVGENGAGKSTLMSILFGIYSPDFGTISINNKLVKFDSAKDSVKYGLGMVHQHFKLVDETSVLDNIILGNEHSKNLGFINRKKIKKELENIIQKYKFNINLDEKVKNLSVGQQQKVEILKLLYRNLDILIFDEPTAVLSKNEIDNFLEMINDFKKEGKTIIIITHKLSEIKSVADWITVIRKGKYIADFSINEKTIDEIAELIVGSKVDLVINNDKLDPNAKVKFQVKNLDIKSIIKKTNHFKKTKNETSNLSNLKENKINFQIKEGEIFAIAGVEGNGQSELALAIAGIIETKANFILDDVDINKLNIKKRIKSGLSSVPEDRHKYGLILDLPIAFNSVLHNIDDKPFSKFGFISYNNVYKQANNIIYKYDVRGSTRGTSDARLLSGGNQQKLVIGREFEKPFELLLLVQPTRGMDLGAISFIHNKILEAKKNKKAILLISYELDEILSLADTVAIMQNGEFLDILPRDKIDRQKIGEIMLKGN